MKLPWMDCIRGLALIFLVVALPLAGAFTLVANQMYWLAAIVGGVGIFAAVRFYLSVRSGYRQGIKSWRKETGNCIACGYDLRASPERCPECGKLTEWGRKAQQEA